MNELTLNGTALEEESGITKKFLSEVIDPTFDLAIDFSEIFIDDIIDNPALREIPIIKSVVGMINAGISINQFWFAKKILAFIKEFSLGQASEIKINEFRHKLNSDAKFGKKIAERLLITIDKNIELTQTLILANLFTAFIEDNLSYEEFHNISITLDKLNPISFQTFFEFEKFDFKINEKNSKDIGKRDFEMETIIINSGFAMGLSAWFAGFDLTQNGRKLFDYGIKPLKKA